MEFDKLVMAKKPYQNFIAEFNSLAAQCGKTDEQKVDSLELKVSQELANEAAHQIIKPDRTNFAAWTALYQNIWNSLQESQHVDKLRAKQNTFYRPAANPDPRTSATTPAASTPDPDAMQLDALRPRPSREECVARGLCFYCRKPGHSRNECEEKKVNDARFSRANNVGTSQTQDFGGGRDGFGNPRGRGGYQARVGYQARGGYQAHGGYGYTDTDTTQPPAGPQTTWGQQTWGQQFQRPTNPRMRALEYGYVEGEVSSTTSSTPSVLDAQDFTPSSASSGKE